MPINNCRKPLISSPLARVTGTRKLTGFSRDSPEVYFGVVDCSPQINTRSNSQDDISHSR
jgi:hypothetical protein